MTDFERRKILAAGGAALSIGLAGCVGPFTDEQGVPGTTSGGNGNGNGNGNGEENGGGMGEAEQYLSDANQYDSLEDMTGQDEVTVEVGVGEQGYGFSPPAIQVDPGTTVTWEWTGEGGQHNVIDEDGAFESQLTGEAGFTFEHAFEEEGTTRYFCRPHKALGMKGAVVVGSGSGGGGGGGGVPAEVEDYLSDGNLYDGGLEDRTGEDSLTVEVGAGEQGYGFSPPAVQVDPGTTITWEWTGEGGQHNVIDEDGAFESELTGEAGSTFEHTFEEEGTTRYFCRPHKALGMKGAVVVSGGGGGGGGGVPSEVEDHLSDANQYDGSVADMTGESSVTVQNGTNEPQYAFDPAAIRVDAGTEVTWEWVADVQHSVTHNDEVFNSGIMGGADATFSHTFEEAGVYLYHCIPHRALGQKGAVIVE